MALEYRHIFQKIFVVVLIGQSLACENALYFGARWAYLACSGSQSEHRIRLILLVRGFSHMIIRQCYMTAGSDPSPVVFV